MLLGVVIGAFAFLFSVTVILDAYEKSIDQRMLAEIEVRKLRQNAKREKVQAEIVVTQVKAKADAIRAEAQAAQADAIKFR